MLPQSDLMHVRICGINTVVPTIWHDWVLHLANCKQCYSLDRASNIRSGPCIVEQSLHSKLDEFNNSRSEHVT